MLKRIFAAMLACTLAGPAMAAGGNVELQQRDWSFSGPFGTFDKAAMQRGFQAYREVCAGCHSLELVAFRNFA
ncbi:MAG: cytochrome c1, partial [Candidatus Puniceispirillaceae bacterium]